MRSTGFSWIDWAAIGLYTVVVFWIAWRAYQKRDSAEAYFIGGKGMGPWVIGLSMFITLFSTNAYLSEPGELIRYGPSVILGEIISTIPAYFIVAYWAVPVLMRRRVISAYALLEDKLGIEIRRVAAGMYILTRIVWMAVMIYVASVAVVVIFGLDDGWRPYIAAAAAAVAIFYTSLGGLRAVMMTDALQFGVLFFGAGITITITSWHFGGFNWFPTQWPEHWGEQAVFSWDITLRATLIGGIVKATVIIMAQSIADQTQVQRYMAADSVEAARRSVLIKSIAKVVIYSVVGLAGLAVMAYYSNWDAKLAGTGLSLTSGADRLFPHFIRNELVPGMAGLVAIALFAAAMSSIDSGVNAISAVIMNDFLGRFDRNVKSDVENIKFARVLAMSVGVFVVGFSLLMPHVPGNFNEIIARTTHILLPMLLGLFLSGLFIPFSTAFGTVMGLLYGIFSGFVLAYWEPLMGASGISFQYYALAIILIQVGIGCLFSLVPGRQLHGAGKLVWGLVGAVPLIVGMFWVLSLAFRATL